MFLYAIHTNHTKDDRMNNIADREKTMMYYNSVLFNYRRYNEINLDDEEKSTLEKYIKACETMDDDWFNLYYGGRVLYDKMVELFKANDLRAPIFLDLWFAKNRQNMSKAFFTEVEKKYVAKIKENEDAALEEMKNKMYGPAKVVAKVILVAVGIGIGLLICKHSSKK